jgi:hypothetical protein
MSYNPQLWRDVARLSAHFHQTHLPTIEANKWPAKRVEFMDVLVCARDLSDALARYAAVFLADAHAHAIPAEWGRPWSPLGLRTVNVMLQFDGVTQYQPVVFVNATWAVGYLKQVTGMVSAVWQDAARRVPLRELETMDLYAEICELGELLVEALERA